MLINLYCWLFGVVVGFAVFIGFWLCFKIKFHVGYLRIIDNTEPDEAPLIFLELNESPWWITTKKYALLKVKTQNYTYTTQK